MNKRICIALLLLAFLWAEALPLATVSAAEDAGELTIETEAAGLVSVTWPATPARTAQPFWQAWPRVDVGGVEAHARLLSFLLTDPEGFAIEVERLATRPWQGRTTPLKPVEPVHPLAPSGEERPDLAPTRSAQMPDEPVIVLRRGTLRGRTIVVLAVLPVFADAANVQEVTDLRFHVRGASLLDESQTQSLLAMAADAPWLAPEQTVGPAPVSGKEAIQIHVNRWGIQAISVQELLDSGFVETIDQLPRLHLTRNGEEHPLQTPATADGDLLFYAPPPGDRWNRHDVYWLSLEETPGLRMQTRPALTTDQETLPLRTWALEPGEWYVPQLYDSVLPGPDGDHWFAADLRTGPELPSKIVTATLASRLPPLDRAETLTVTGTAYTRHGHNLQIQLRRGQTVAASSVVTWSGTGNWSNAVTFDGRSTAALLSLQSGTVPDGIQIDRLAWLRPVALTLAGGGAHIETPAGPALYRIERPPADVLLYDVTDPERPVSIEIDGQAGAEELILASEGGRRYLLAPIHHHRLHLPLIQMDGPAPVRNADESLPMIAVQRPSWQHHRPPDWQTALDADVLYIGPAPFLPTLDPLLDDRRAAGYVAATVDVQTIYDGWSGGTIDPRAIRAFLRYASAHGARAPRAAILVGDGTSDPLNYTQKNGVNWMPPYLAPVDPWLGETACDACFAQLDGDDPRADPLPDLWIGRLPVKSAAETAALVAKIRHYEQGAMDLRSRARAVYVTDNYRNADGTVDIAGNFIRAAEHSAALQPLGVTVERIYYDPVPEHSDSPGHEPDAVTAHRKTLAALDAGAGFVTYIGHAHHWQWASTDLSAEPPYLLGLYDVDQLTNRDALPIVLEMTCLTAAFQQPAISGTTIDERLLLHENGGAAAVWGPAGLGVAYGHDSLQRGFYEAFWREASNKQLGALTQAGFVELFTAGACCQEALRTYVLLGDPLTVPQPAALQMRYAPLVSAGE